MTKRIINLAAAGWACACLVASPVLAASTPLPFCGTVVPLTEGGCIGVKAGGTTYELGETNPKPSVGMVISGSGVVSNVMSTCMEGKHLTNITWRSVTSCPAGIRRPVGY
jgi:hypothetical protein